MKVAYTALLSFILCAQLRALDLYVSSTGSDDNPGTANSPFATITHARDAIRDLKEANGLPQGGVTVWLAAGIYNQADTFSLDDRDSGTNERPVVYSALPGQEARITGANTLDPSWFQRVDDTSPVWSRLDPAARGKVYSVDLKEHGVSDFGTLKVGGFHLYRTSPLELFVNGRPMTLARWPNKDRPLERTVSAPSNSRFIYSNPRPERWLNATDVWLHGLWKTDWADFHVEVSSINTGTKAINLVDPPAQFGLGDNQPYYAYNLLEELDEPEEYYLDRDSGILYFWPSSPIEGSTIQVSMLEPCLVEISGARFITLRGLTLEATRGPLLNILEGEHNSIEECLLRNCGEYGAKITGTNNGIDRSEIAACGEDGVELGGGARATLTPGNNFVRNCRIHRIARNDWSYHPAIVFTSGCGNLASHNLIEDLPHAAIMFSGNNHTIEFNEIRRVCQRTEDTGAIYAGRDWSYRGNIIRANFIHHLHSDIEGPGPNGVYLDDGMSGAQVIGNVFYKVDGAATYYGGGRDNITSNNIMAFTQIAHCNGDYDRMFISNTPGSPWNFLERLAADGIQYQQEPWLSAYPACAAIPNSWQTIKTGTWRNPEHSVFSENGGWSNQVWMYESNYSHTGVFAVYGSITANDPHLRPLFDEASTWDRTLRPHALVASIEGFTPIQFGSIGPSAPTFSSSKPQPPALSAITVTNSEIDLNWVDDGDLPWQRPNAARLFEEDGPGGEWRQIRSVGLDCEFAPVTSLAPATVYSFRVESVNSVGSTTSNTLSVKTLPNPPVYSEGTRFEAESPLEVVRSIGKSGAVSAVSGSYVSGKCVTLFDPGDAIVVSFTTAVSGTYRIGARVRSGGSNMPIGTEFWPSGYRFKLDGAAIKLTGDPSTVSQMTKMFGPTYWGMMFSDSIVLAAGEHEVEVTSNARWTAIDYIETDPINASP